MNDKFIQIIPTITSVLNDYSDRNLHVLAKLINFDILPLSRSEVEKKIISMSMSEVFDVENKLKFDMLKLNSQELKSQEIKLQKMQLNDFTKDRRDARKVFAKDKTVLYFGMIMAFVAILIIVFFAYKSLFIADDRLHFVREIKAFLEGSILTLIMQYFFGSAHKESVK